MKILFLFLSLLLASNAWASVGTITALKGSASVERNQIQIPIKLGAAIEANDSIHTGAKSRLQIMFQDKTVVTLGQNTQFTVNDYVFDGSDSSNATLSVIKGFLKAMTGEIGKLAPERFNVKTKTATIGIRGTVYTLEVTNQMTRLTTLSGATHYRDHATNTLYDVPKNFQLTHTLATQEIKIEALKKAKEDDSSSIDAPQKTLTFKQKSTENTIPDEFFAAAMQNQTTETIDSFVDINTGTDTAILDSAIKSGATGKYTGKFDITDSNNDTKSTNLVINIDFAGGSSAVTGNLNYKYTDTTHWNFDYEGTVNTSGINVDTFTSKGGGSVTDISGTFTGKFYGSRAEKLSGDLNLTATRADLSSASSKGSFSITGNGL